MWHKLYQFIQSPAVFPVSAVLICAGFLIAQVFFGVKVKWIPWEK